jgi:hypothetical protein
MTLTALAVREMMSSKMLHQANKLRSTARRPAAVSPLDDGLPFTVRFAYPDDEPALRRLAALDSRSVPEGPLLVAEINGELWAAVTIADEPSPIADPFRHTSALVDLLEERARALNRPSRERAASRLSLRTAWS